MSHESAADKAVMSNANRLTLRIVHRIKRFLRTHKFKGSRDLLKIANKRLVISAKGPTISPTLYDFDLLVDATVDKGLEKKIFDNGVYEEGALTVIGKCLRKGDIFVDVGSNIGLMSLLSSRIVCEGGEVYSFEPQPNTFAILKTNIEINKADNIFGYNIALGSVRGSATIYNSHNGNRGAASFIKSTESCSKGVNVSIQTLDDFISEKNISNIRMIKIDVEGWELEVLKGAQNILGSPEAPIICIEYSNLHPVYQGELLDIYNFILTVNNYKVYKLEKGKERISKLIEISHPEELPSHDNLFCFLPFHLKDLDKNIFI